MSVILEELEGGTSTPEVPPVIDLRGISRSFPGDPPVVALHPTDLVVGQGEYLSIVGPSAARFVP